MISNSDTIDPGISMAHQLADLTQDLFLLKNKSGLEGLAQNLDILRKHINNCIYAIEFINNSSDVFSTILLVIDFLEHNSPDEDFSYGLEMLYQRALGFFENHENIDQNENEEEEILNEEILNKMRAIMDRNDAIGI